MLRFGDGDVCAEGLGAGVSGDASAGGLGGGGIVTGGGLGIGGGGIGGGGNRGGGICAIRTDPLFAQLDKHPIENLQSSRFSPIAYGPAALPNASVIWQKWKASEPAIKTCRRDKAASCPLSIAQL
jgi:hypothetical protein